MRTFSTRIILFMLIAFNGLFAAVSPDFPIAGWAVSEIQLAELVMEK